MAILVERLSTPPLPLELWLAVLGGLSYADLRLLRAVNRSFQALADSPALGGHSFRTAVVDDGDGSGGGHLDVCLAGQNDKSQPGVFVRLHPLFRSAFLPAIGAPFEAVLVDDSDFPGLEADHHPVIPLSSSVRASIEQATSPPTTRLLVAISDELPVPTAAVEDPAGVKVAAVWRAWCDLAQRAVPDGTTYTCAGCELEHALPAGKTWAELIEEREREMLDEALAAADEADDSEDEDDDDASSASSGASHGSASSPAASDGSSVLVGDAWVSGPGTIVQDGEIKLWLMTRTDFCLCAPLSRSTSAALAAED